MFREIEMLNLRSPHVKKMLPNLCNEHIANAEPVTSFFAIAPHMAALKMESMILCLLNGMCELCEANLLAIFQTTNRPSSRPPKLIKCTPSDEKHNARTSS